MRPRLIYNLLSIFIIFLSTSGAKADGPDNLRNEIFYTVFRDNIPYIICNQKDRLYKIQSVLLHNEQNTDLNDFGLKLKLDKFNKIVIPGFDFEFRSEGNEIIANKNAIDELFGFYTGDNLVVQKVEKEGKSPRLVVTIDKVIFYAERQNSCIVFKCLPIDSSDINKMMTNGKSINIYAYYQHNLKNIKIDDYNIETVPTPSIVKNKLDYLGTNFFSYDEQDHLTISNKSIIPIRFIDHEGKKHFFFIGLLSIGHKSYKSSLFLLDENGNEIQKIADKEHTRIIGILETNNRTSQAVVLAFGGYGGGYEVMTFRRYPEKITKNKPILTSKYIIETYFD